MLQLVLATLCALSTESRAVTFDEAKADASKRMAYLGQLLDGKVFDKDKNPNGLIKAWYFVADEKQKAAAQEDIKARYKKDGREFFFAKESAAIFAPLESSARRATAWYSDAVAAGSGSKSGIVLVGDIFSLGSEDEARSVIEDYALSLVQMREAGLKVKDLELDANIPALKLVSNKSLLPLFAQAGQLEAVLKGGRKVSDGFKKDLTQQYLATHGVFGKMFAHEKKVFDDNNENTLQKEIVDFLDECFKFGHERFKTLGYEHKLLNKENNEWGLEKK
ncbi:MAG: hypothetical protein EHM91_00590 [Planctomycetota bacterium]|nr:MAG: hypothetical protein EHM91_00590 [Planctomycetota bacterium]